MRVMTIGGGSGDPPRAGIGQPRPRDAPRPSAPLASLPSGFLVRRQPQKGSAPLSRRDSRGLPPAPATVPPVENRILLGDNLELLKALPDGSVAMAYADP